MRWLLLDGSYFARLAVCNARVPPLRGLSVPRGVLTALTFLARLMLSVILALRKLEPPSNSLMLVDLICYNR